MPRFARLRNSDETTNLCSRSLHGTHPRGSVIVGGSWNGASYSHETSSRAHLTKLYKVAVESRLRCRLRAAFLNPRNELLLIGMPTGASSPSSSSSARKPYVPLDAVLNQTREPLATRQKSCPFIMLATWYTRFIEPVFTCVSQSSAPRAAECRCPREPVEWELIVRHPVCGRAHGAVVALRDVGRNQHAQAGSRIRHPGRRRRNCHDRRRPLAADRCWRSGGGRRLTL